MVWHLSEDFYEIEIERRRLVPQARGAFRCDQDDTQLDEFTFVVSVTDRFGYVLDEYHACSEECADELREAVVVARSKGVSHDTR